MTRTNWLLILLVPPCMVGATIGGTHWLETTWPAPEAVEVTLPEQIPLEVQLLEIQLEWERTKLEAQHKHETKLTDHWSGAVVFALQWISDELTRLLNALDGEAPLQELRRERN